MVSNEKSLILLRRIIDVMLTICAFMTAYFIKKYCLPAWLAGLTETSNYILSIFMILIIWSISFIFFNIHKDINKLSESRYIIEIIKIITINISILLIIFYIVKVNDISRLLIFLFYILNILYISMSFLLIKKINKNKASYKILLAAMEDPDISRELAEAITNDTSLNYEIIGCLGMNECDIGKTIFDDIKVVGTLDDMQPFLAENMVDGLIFTAPIEKIWEVERYLSMAETMGVPIRILPHRHLRTFLDARPKFYSMSFDLFFGHPTLVLRPTATTRGALLFKSMFDFLFAFVLLILLFPLFSGIACIVGISSPGPIFYRQERCGLYGRKFTLYKFRTMIADAHTARQNLMNRNEADGVVFKIKNDPRIIPYVGKFLRKYSLDELPNLINVLQGNMSIVGPRPPLAQEVACYEPWERRRLSMKPGLTCLWQVAPRRNSIPFKKWMEMDLKYIDNWSIGMDIKILLQTLRAVLSGYGM